jgi:hypothetical protein
MIIMLPLRPAATPAQEGKNRDGAGLAGASFEAGTPVGLSETHRRRNWRNKFPSAVAAMPTTLADGWK